MIETQKSIEKFTKKMRSKCGCKKGKLDYIKLINKLGGFLQKDDLNAKDDSVLFLYEQDAFKIITDKKVSDKRTRFLAIYEIGCKIFDGSLTMMSEEFSECFKNNIEIEMAKYFFNKDVILYFTLSLLMPKTEFEEVLNKECYLNSRHDIIQTIDINVLADFFGVTAEAAANRGEMLGLIKWQAR